MALLKCKQGNAVGSVMHIHYVGLFNFLFDQ